MRPKHVTYTIAASDDDAICQAQTLAGAGSLTLNGALVSGGVATMPIARHLLITAVGDESGVVFTVTGTDRYGSALTEDVTGPNATTTVTTANFKTVTSIASDGALAGNVKVGTANSLETAWIPLDHYRQGWDVGGTVSTGGSMDWDVETTIGDVFNTAEGSLPTFGNLGGSAMGMEIATGVRIKITNHVSGNITMDVVQRR